MQTTMEAPRAHSAGLDAGAGRALGLVRRVGLFDGPPAAWVERNDGVWASRRDRVAKSPSSHARWGNPRRG